MLTELLGDWYLNFVKITSIHAHILSVNKNTYNTVVIKSAINLFNYIWLILRSGFGASITDLGKKF